MPRRRANAPGPARKRGLPCTNRTECRRCCPAAHASESLLVQGLGVTDALRVVLSPCQLPWLLDELHELRGALEGVSESDRRASSRDLDRDLRAIARLWTDVVAALAQGETASVWAHTSLMTELVRGTTRNVTEALIRRLDAGSAAAARPSPELRETAAAVNSWVLTYADLLEVQWFSAEADRNRT